MSVRMEMTANIVEKPSELIWFGIKPTIAKLRLGRLAPALARALTFIHMGSLIEAPDEKDNWRTRVLWEEATRRGIAMKEFRLFGLARDFYFATYGRDTIAFDGLPRPRGARETSLAWMDDKGRIIKVFRDAGVPVPRGKSCATLAQAESTFNEIGGPVIVKPNLGSRSRHTYVHIANIDDLRHAFKKAKELSPFAVVEEELKGFVFRVTLVAGEVAGIMRREPPHVTGDGVHDVKTLVALENKNPLRHGPIFHELALGEEAEAELKKRQLAPSSVPPKGAMVMLHEKVSRAFGASTTEISFEDVHPDNLTLFKKIARVLDDPIVGVDFMMERIDRSWHDQSCGVIECNSLPFIDLHHYPLKGTPRNAAGSIWTMVFPESGAATTIAAKPSPSRTQARAQGLSNRQENAETSRNPVSSQPL